MKGVATHGINGRLAENDGGLMGGRKGEEAEVFVGARRHAAPGDCVVPRSSAPMGRP